jgi:hypothetical protein
MFRFSYLLATAILSVGLLFSACNKDDENPEPLPAQTGSLSAPANPSGMGPFAYFSFEQGAAVNLSQANTNSWDFGLRFTTFITNSGISGPGQGGVILLDAVFDEVLEAPETGYRTDAEGELAITDGDWYVYNAAQMEFSPIAGKVFVFRTGEGKYAKMELINVEPTDADGNVVTPPTFPTLFRYNFRYVFQADGSRTF